jgi:hypothetical protein
VDDACLFETEESLKQLNGYFSDVLHPQSLEEVLAHHIIKA